MAFCRINFVGRSLRMDARMNVICPEEPGRYPVLYLLHGLSHDADTWWRHGRVERHAAGLPLIVVMPEGQRGFYCNDPRPTGMACEDHIVRDVVGLVDGMFPTIPRRGARAIAGMSMGGYGAMMLALRHPDVFSVAAPIAPAIFFAHDLKREGPAGVHDLARALPKGQYDCFALARRMARTRARLAVRICCGAEDGLLPCNREFHRHLSKLGLQHEFIETPGRHNSDYWDAQLPEVLAYVTANLTRKG